MTLSSGAALSNQSCVVEQVRAALTVLVAEINAKMPDCVITPPPEVADNAVDRVLNGKRNKICVVTQQSGSTMTTTSQRNIPTLVANCGSDCGWPGRDRGELFALMQARGWSSNARMPRKSTITGDGL